MKQRGGYYLTEDGLMEDDNYPTDAYESSTIDPILHDPIKGQNERIAWGPRDTNKRYYNLYGSNPDEGLIGLEKWITRSNIDPYTREPLPYYVIKHIREIPFRQFKRIIEEDDGEGAEAFIQRGDMKRLTDRNRVELIDQAITVYGAVQVLYVMFQNDLLPPDYFRNLINLIVAENNIPLMNKIIESHDGVNSRFGNIQKPLLSWVSSFDNGTKVDNAVKVIKYLLEKGANPNLLDYDGNTALAYALFPEILRELVKGGADPNMEASTTTQLVQLFYNIDSDMTEQMMDEMINAGFNSDQRPRYRNGMSLLSEAIGQKLEAWEPGYPGFRQGKEYIQILLRTKPSLKTKDNDGKTAMDHAMERGDTEIIEMLKQYRRNMS